MNILIVNHGVIPVKLYGGTERVIWYLGKELSQMGHKISYLVNEGSTCNFGKVHIIDHDKPFHKQIPSEIDIVHFNFVPKEIEKINIPYIITIHGNTNSQTEYPLNTSFVSKNHANRFGSDSFVYNGLDWDDYGVVDYNKKDYFHFIGNAAWRIKNVKGAINLINKTPKAKLHVLGGKRFNISMGVRLTISPKIKFYGMIGGEAKLNQLRYSKGLVFPVRWHEPFGLAITESLYFGAPAFGTPYGSLKELITPEVGFTSSNFNEVKNAISNSDAYSKQKCHEYALDLFNSKVMAQAYLNKYETILNGNKLNATKPKLKDIQSEKFLPWNK